MALTLQGTTDFNQAAYDLVAWYALRPELHFDAAASVGSTSESMRGKSVTFTIVNDIAIASTPLTDGVDVTPVAMSDSQIQILLAEYGAAITTTAKNRGTSFVDIDPIVANLIGFNAGISVNDVARAALASGTSVMYGSGLGATSLQTAVTTRVGVAAGTNELGSVDLRVARARLASANVQRLGAYYVAFMSPDVVADLMGESFTNNNTQGWTAAQVYSDPANVLLGEIGAYQGFRIVETPTAPIFAGAGAVGINVYGTLCMGRDALAKAFSHAPGFGPMPHIFPGPVVDTLRRNQPFGWYWLGQYSIFRQASVIRIESSSTLNADYGTVYDPAINQ